MKLSLVRALALLPLLSGAFLDAQVDPRLAVCKTDVLDVYFGSSSQGAKPEIISIIDNSTSMSGIYWSKYFYTNTSPDQGDTGTWHNNPWSFASADDYHSIVPIVYKSGSGASVSITVSLHQSLYATGMSLDAYATPFVTGGLLVKPNGDPVVYSDVNSDDPKLWIQRASHVRFALTSIALNGTATYTYKSVTYTVPNTSGNRGVKPRPLSTGGTSADYTSASQGNVLSSDQIRVVDVPIPWGAFDAVPYYEGENTSGYAPDGSAVPAIYKRPLSPAPVWPSGDYSTAKTNKHPQHAYVYDPGPAGGTYSWYEVDALWSQGSRMYDGGTLTNQVQDGILQPTSALNWRTSNGYNASTPTNAYGKIGMFHYSADYLWWVFFGQDVRAQGGGINPGGAYLNGMVNKYSGTNWGGYTVPDVRQNGAGFVLNGGVAGNGLPCLTKFMAIKKALFQTYVANQSDVFWAIRFLTNDPSPTAAQCYDSNNLDGNPGDRQLLLLNPPTSSNQPDANSTRYVISMAPLRNTPLTAAMMSTYAQMANAKTGNSGSVFNRVGAQACGKSFVIVLSDGSPTDTGSGATDPYETGATDGNNAVIAHPTYLKGKSLFSIQTMAAVAAHHPNVGDTSSWDSSTAGSVSVPWAITTRGATTTNPRYTSTITIGVGLSGTLLDPAGTQRGMYSAALYGWEARTLWNIKSGTAGYNAPDPYMSTSTATKKNVNPFFFDANDPDKLSEALDTAISLTRVVTNTMGAPVAPLVGLSVGKQIYLGTFTTPDSAVWYGDLLMAGMSESGSSVTIQDKTGATTSVLDHDSAVWSAADALKAKGWKQRTIYTLKPDSSNWPTGPSHPGAFTKTLIRWKEDMSTTDVPNAVLGVTSDTARRSLIRFMMGALDTAQADPAPITSITASRDDLMGDIINSTPAILEFPLSAIPGSSSLSSFDRSGLVNPRFRVILVGDNQGIFHAFGEVSGIDKTLGYVKGAVDELWGIIPPDILIGLDAWRQGPQHLYLMDGSPIVYFSERGTANGVVDGDDVVRVAFGLGKAGRSTYCLTFDKNDPSAPVISWMIRPDEKPAGSTGADLAIRTMGFSTSKPALARIKNGSYLADVFFIGGGLSTTDVDTAFSASGTANPPGLGGTVKLGRSILAVNVFDGGIEKYWDFYNDSTLKTNYPTMGCIPASPVPVEAIPGSYRTQRVYFSDTSGSVSVLGAVASSGSRVDTADITAWGIRKFFTPTYAGTVVSTSPAVFFLPGGYPVARTVDPKPIVPTLGVVFSTGDRNDPMDNDAVNPNNNTTPNRNRLYMILDRQDSANITGSLGKVDLKGFTDATTSGGDLTDLTAVTSTSDSNISPAYPYLKTKFGYQLSFTMGTTKPATSGSTGSFYQKGVTSPLVLNGALFFSHYTPNNSSSVCGGSGTTYTYRMCDVLAPVYANGTVKADASADGCNGWAVSYNDIPSELASVGLGAVLQAGEVQTTGDTGNTEGSGKSLVTPISGPPLSKLLRPRAWRVVR